VDPPVQTGTTVVEVGSTIFLLYYGNVTIMPHSLSRLVPEKDEVKTQEQFNNGYIGVHMDIRGSLPAREVILEVENVSKNSPA
jgi:hypothetical protein